MTKRKNLKIIICVGMPASGKSTWAKNFISKNDKYVIVSRDSFRGMLKNQDFCEPNIEALITKLVNTSIEHALAAKQNVIYDATNLKMKSINEIIKEFGDIADIDYMFFDVPLKTCLERDALRPKPVGEEVIKRMNNNFLILRDSFSFQPHIKTKQVHLTPNFESELPDAVIFDIDGTLSLMNKRSPYDWDRVDEDDVNEIVFEQLMFQKSLDRKIILMSGRDGAALDKTKEWLEFYKIPYDYLFLKGVDDNRKDSIIKAELYENHIKDKFNILFAVDDRISICRLWFSKGIFCFCVNQNIRIF